MELPKISRSNGDSGSMLDNLKSRFGFSSSEKGSTRKGYGNDGYADSYDEYDDGYDGYDDYGENGFDEEAYDDYAEPSSQYEPYAPVTTRSTGRSSSYSSSPRLVTIDDVKASDRLSRNSASAEGRKTGSSRLMVDSTVPNPASPAGVSSSRERSEGLNSLFTPTAPAAQAAPQQATAAAPRATASRGTRTLKVFRPVSYNDVEGVARTVRAGDVAVLSLKATPEALFNRVLDFSFGAASALDAQVDCIGAKVFAISTGAALSEAEKASLKGQGVI